MLVFIGFHNAFGPRQSEAAPVRVPPAQAHVLSRRLPGQPSPRCLLVPCPAEAPHPPQIASRLLFSYPPSLSAATTSREPELFLSHHLAERKPSGSISQSSRDPRYTASLCDPSRNELLPSLSRSHPSPSPLTATLAFSETRDQFASPSPHVSSHSPIPTGSHQTQLN